MENIHPATPSIPFIFEQASSPAADLSMPDTPRTFETDVTSVIRSGLIMRPIYELESRRLRQSDEDDRHEAWESVDVIWLAFAILDVISEMTEYNAGVSRNEVIEKILPLARKQAEVRQSDITHEALLEVLHKIFDHLANRENRYLPFAYKYFDGTSGQFLTRKFWLIKNIYTGEGSTALYTLTEEGYMAYFGLFETGALDATAIGNLRIRLLIERGNVDDAISVAEQNRKQCMRKSHEIRTLRRAIRRSIRSVDFEKLMALSDEGGHHSTQIQTESSKLQHMIRDKLMNIPLHTAENTDDRSSKNENAQQHKLQKLAEHLEKLNVHLLILSAELLHLPDEYDQHSHKLFRKRAAGILPTADEVMRRVCLLEETGAADIGRQFIARFDPPVCKTLFNPATVIEACDRALERRNPSRDRSLPVHEIEEESLHRYTSELNEELMNPAFVLLQTAVQSAGDTLLSVVLKEASEIRESPVMPVAVAMAVFHCLADSHVSRKWRLDISMKNPEEKFCMLLPDGRQYRGHELILQTSSGSRSEPVIL